jgi:hypothetical protein
MEQEETQWYILLHSVLGIICGIVCNVFVEMFRMWRTNVEISVMPFPIRTLFKLIVGRPSRIATWFRSIISLANTGKYRP